jgi:hypothetical protein
MTGHTRASRALPPLSFSDTFGAIPAQRQTYSSRTLEQNMEGVYSEEAPLKGFDASKRPANWQV